MHGRLATPAEALSHSLTLRHERSGATCTLPRRVVLAPMEGVTDAVFRDQVIALGGVGGACTEFIRISNSAMSVKVIRRYLGSVQQPVPVGVQFMAADEAHLAVSIAAAERLQAPWIDLNFGCPVPVVFNKCAGSALLNHPEQLARITRCAVEAATVPVSVKIRAGVNDTSHLREIVAAVAENGAAMLTVHARLRVTSYAQPATWSWIAEACAERDCSGRAMPIIGNGGIDTAADAHRMVQETGCDGVMIGRAALADPWIFSTLAGGNAATKEEAARFAMHYADAITAAHASARGTLAKLKQLIRYYMAGDLFAEDPAERQRLLRCDDLATVMSWFKERCNPLGAASTLMQ